MFISVWDKGALFFGNPLYVHLALIPKRNIQNFWCSGLKFSIFVHLLWLRTPLVIYLTLYQSQSLLWLLGQSSILIQWYLPNGIAWIPKTAQNKKAPFSVRLYCVPIATRIPTLWSSPLIIFWIFKVFQESKLFSLNELFLDWKWKWVIFPSCCYKWLNLIFGPICAPKERAWWNRLI